MISIGGERLEESEIPTEETELSLSGVNVSIDEMMEGVKARTDHCTVVAIDPNDSSLMITSNEPGNPMALLGIMYCAVDQLKERLTGSEPIEDNST